MKTREELLAAIEQLRVALKGTQCNPGCWCYYRVTGAHEVGCIRARKAMIETEPGILNPTPPIGRE